MRNSFKRFLVLFLGCILAAILPYSFLRILVEIFSFFIIGTFTFSIPIELIYGAIASGLFVSLLLLFEKR